MMRFKDDETPKRRLRTFPSICSNLEKIKTTVLVLTILASLLAATPGCKSVLDRQDVRPLLLRDVPAQRLAFRFEPDVGRPPALKDATNEKIAAVQNDFSTQRANDALLRTVTSPDGQRALALYNTGDEPSPTFHIDLYSSDGKFLHNVSPPTFSCVFPETVLWAPDGNSITFIARKKIAPSPTPTPPPELAPAPESSPVTTPSVGPAFPPIAVFATEQIYISNRDGFDLRPLTSREGLIYFYAVWAPDSHAIVALACKEDEWDARERQHLLPAGRPRLLAPDGSERLLDDRLTEALPVWSPDASKVATGFSTDRDFDVVIYDAATNKPTQGRIRLREAMIAASNAYEQKASKSSSPKPGTSTAGGTAQVSEGATKALPPSFNPIITLEWTAPDKLFFQTAYVRLLPNETINTFPRWHLLNLSSQSAILR